MNQFTDFHLYSGGVANAASDVTEPTLEADSLILNSEVLHNIFINACPELKSASPESIRIISKLIEAYWYGKDSILSVIKAIIQDDIMIETIQGIEIIIQEENIQDIRGIEEHMIGIKASNEICTANSY